MSNNALDVARQCASVCEMMRTQLTMPERVRAAEGAIAGAGLSIGDFCREVGIHRATWQRWKAGRSAPDVPAWERVVATLRTLRPLGPAAAEAVDVANVATDSSEAA